MKKLNKILAVILAVSSLSLPVSAYRVKESEDEFFGFKTTDKSKENIMFYDDFSKSVIDEVPSGYEIVTQFGAKVKIKEEFIDNKLQKIISIDKPEKATATFKKPLGLKKAVKAEIKFRYTENTGNPRSPAFVLRPMGEKHSLGEIYCGSLDGAFRLDFNTGEKEMLSAGSGMSNLAILESGYWYTMGIYYDIEKNEHAVYLQSDALKGKTVPKTAERKYDKNTGTFVGNFNKFINKYDVKNIDRIDFYTGTSGNGTIDIAYVKIDDKKVPYELVVSKPNAIIPPYVETPKEFVGTSDIKVIVNDKEIYYPEKVLDNNGIYMAEYRKTLQALGYNSFYIESLKTVVAEGEKGKILIKVNEDKMTLNGKTIDIPKTLIYKNTVALPVTYVAKALGFNVTVEKGIIKITK